MKKLTCTAAVAAVALTLSACGTATQAKAGGDEQAPTCRRPPLRRPPPRRRPAALQKK